MSTFVNPGPGAKEKQGFNIKNDRGIAPITFSDATNSPTMVTLAFLTDELRLTLARTLNRPSMSDINLSHESYFSRSLPGASLARHIDEFHEGNQLAN